jgi:hypothetical protein
MKGWRYWAFAVGSSICASRIRGILKTFGLVVGSGNKGALPNAHGQLTGLGRSIVLGRQKSTGLLPQRTHCYVRRPVDLISPRRT